MSPSVRNERIIQSCMIADLEESSQAHLSPILDGRGLPCTELPVPTVSKPRKKAFPILLYDMMNYMSSNHPHLASWSTTGKLIVIKDRALFSPFLSEFFNTKSFMSFSKQLNVYGFIKLQQQWTVEDSKIKIVGLSKTANIEKGDRWWHPSFHRDSQDNLHMICATFKPKKHSGSAYTKPTISKLLPQVRRRNINQQECFASECVGIPNHDEFQNLLGAQATVTSSENPQTPNSSVDRGLEALNSLAGINNQEGSRLPLEIACVYRNPPCVSNHQQNISLERSEIAEQSLVKTTYYVGEQDYDYLTAQAPIEQDASLTKNDLFEFAILNAFDVDVYSMDMSAK